MKQRRGIRSIIIRAGIFLLHGAIVNIAVAWGCDYWGSFSYPSSPALGIKPEEEAAKAPSEFAFEFTPEWRLEGSAFGQTRVRYIDEDLHKPLYIFVEEYRTGWPLPCLYGEWWVAIGPPHGPPTGGQASRYVVNKPMDAKYVLPWLPMLPGFAINTLFYAAILWLLFAAPFTLRRWRRLKRGLCPACAYPVGTSEVCTECGKPLPVSLKARVERTS